MKTMYLVLVCLLIPLISAADDSWMIGKNVTLKTHSFEFDISYYFTYSGEIIDLKEGYVCVNFNKLESTTITGIGSLFPKKEHKEENISIKRWIPKENLKDEEWIIED